MKGRKRYAISRAGGRHTKKVKDDTNDFKDEISGGEEEKAVGQLFPDRPSVKQGFFAPLTRWIRQVIVWSDTFDRFILIAIFSNCIFIAMDNPLRDEDDPLKLTLDISEMVFAIIFFIEMVIKWIALGWCGRDKVDLVYEGKFQVEVEYSGYFLNGWNILDFVIVLSSLTSITTISGSNTSSIRILRVLRPLRTIAKVKELRILVQTIFNSLRGLADVGILLVFIAIIFAIIGTQLFSGTLRQRCFYDINPNYSDANWNITDETYSENKFYFRLEDDINPPLPSTNCTSTINNTLSFQPEQYNETETSCFITDNNHTLTYFAKSKRLYQENYYESFLYYDHNEENYFCNHEYGVSEYCHKLDAVEHPNISGVWMTSSFCLRNHENPDARMTCFDNIFFSLLMVFVVSTLEGWVDIMYKVQVTYHPSAFIFFILLTLLASYFSLNLCIAVMEDVYSESVAKETHFEALPRVKSFLQKHMPDTKRRARTILQVSSHEILSADTQDQASNPFETNPVRNEASKLETQQEEPGKQTQKGIGMDEGRSKETYLEKTKSKAWIPVHQDPINQSMTCCNSKFQLCIDKVLTSTEKHIIVDSKKETNRMPDAAAPLLDEHRPARRLAFTDDPHPVRRWSSRSSARSRATSLVIDQAKILEKYHPNELKEISSYTINQAKPQDGLKMGRKGKIIGRIKKDPLEKFHNELIIRERIALTALATVQREPDAYFKRHKKNKFIMFNRAIVESRWFIDLIRLTIVLNTISLAIYWPEITHETQDLLETFNFMFTISFNVEMVIKLIGLGPMAYINDNWNVFDGLVVIESDIEMLAWIINPHTDSGAISAFRIFRLLRILRVLGQIESLKIILGSVVNSAGDVAYLCLILMLFIFMFSTLGISLFSEAYHRYEEDNRGTFPSGRWRFDYIHNSMLTVFQCITGDAWNTVMFDTKEATYSNFVAFYFMVVVVFGGFIVLNLFIAILLSRMGGEGEDKWNMDASIRLAQKLHEETRDKLKKDEAGQPIETVTSIAYKRKQIVEAIERRQFVKAQNLKKRKTKSNRNKKEIEGRSLGIFGKENKFRVHVHRFVTHQAFNLFIDAAILANCVFLMLEEPKLVGEPLFELANRIFAIIFIFEMVLKVIAMGLLPFPIFVKVRWKLLTGDAILDQSVFEYLTLDSLDKIYQKDPWLLEPIGFHKRGLITRLNLSTNGIVIVEWQTLKTLRLVFNKNELLAVYFQREPGVDLTGHVKPNTNVKKFDEFAWHCWIFTKEVDPEIDKVCRTHDMSNRCHNSYLSSRWNQLDAFVVFISILGFIVPSQKVIQGLRGIRPLRIAVRFDATKVILSSLIRACPAMVNVFIFCLSFWIVLAILGVDWFSGQFQTCACLDEKLEYGGEYCWFNTVTGNDVCEYFYTKQDCENGPDECVWEDEIFNFNDVFQSMHTLFVVSSMSGWNDVMYRAIDTNGLGKLPKMNNRVHASLYFVAVILMCAFFSLNLIISVVLDNFQRIKSEKEGSALVTEDQWKWVQTRRVVSRLGLERKVFPPAAAWRLTMFTIIMHPYFEPIIQACIILNTLTMCLEFYNAPRMLNLILNGLEAFYISVFAIEAFLKISGLGWTQYWRSNWNKFDLFIVVVGVVSLFKVTGKASFHVLRLFRIGRVIRLINKAKTLKTLFLTLMYSIPALWNIGLLLVIVLFVYALIGMHLFESKDDKTQWEFGDDRACFRDFTTAFGTLVRISSGDGWTDVYERYLGDVEDKISVYLYFCSFYVLGALVMINLFIAVILESFNEEKDAMKKEQELKTIKVWRAIWQEYDKKSTGTLLAAEFIDMLNHVPRPIGFFNFEDLKWTEEPQDKSDPSLNPAGPTHRDILDLLLKLNLFVEKKPHGENNEMKWCVDYEDTLMFYVTMFMGPEIDVAPAPELHIESMGAADWYALETNTIDILQELIHEHAEKYKKEKMLRYIIDIYVDDLTVDFENTDFSDTDGLDQISLRISTTRETIELQKLDKEDNGSTRGRPV